MNGNKTLLKKQSAASVIEFAIIVPVLILFLMILFECGRMYHVYIRFTSINWEGSRFFSSLSNPSTSCMGAKTSNLAFADPEYYNNLSSAEKLIFESHKLVHERIVSLFLVRPDSWPIESAGKVPCPNFQNCAELRQIALHIPTVSTQHVKSYEDTPCPSLPSQNYEGADMDNTVSVCLEAVYRGMFFNVPLRICSTTHLLENNETLRVPYQTYDF